MSVKKILLGMLCLGMMLCLQSLALAEEGRLMVSGSHEAELLPGYAVIHLNIRHVTKAMALSHQQMISTLDRVVAGLMALGIQERDVVKSVIRQGMEYVWQQKKKIPKGYFSSCTVGIKVRNLENLHGVYGELSRHNALEIRGTSYDREDMEEQDRLALEAALRNAREKAGRMAAVLGVKLGPAMEIREEGVGHTMPRTENMAMSRKASAGSNPGGRFGEVRVQARVTVAFALDN